MLLDIILKGMFDIENYDNFQSSIKIIPVDFLRIVIALSAFQSNKRKI